MENITVFTIGFTNKSAEQFFQRLKVPGLKRVVDIRLNNTTQLAGFTKMNDLRYFLKVINGLDYVHEMLLAPTKEILSEFRKNKGDWQTYEQKYRALITERKVEYQLQKEIINGGCFLCSEDKPDYCHRRLAAEYLKEKWEYVEITHL